MNKKSNLQQTEEIFGCKQVNPKYCETCMFVETREPFGKLPRLANCKIYKYPQSKPEEILFSGAECEYYEKEK